MKTKTKQPKQTLRDVDGKEIGGCYDRMMSAAEANLKTAEAREASIVHESGSYWVKRVNQVPPGGTSKQIYYEVLKNGITHSTVVYFSASLERAKRYADRHAKENQ